jgi:cell division control protein 45
MLLSLLDLDSVYRRIRSETVGPGKTGQCQVLVVSMSNVDGLCSSKILLQMFQSDFIQYLLLPISSSLELYRIGDVYLRSDKLSQDGDNEERHMDGYAFRHLILINCGAGIDLTQCLQLHNHPDLHVYVFDSYRPVNLANVFTDEHVQVIDDGQIENDTKTIWPAFSAIELGIIAEEDINEQIISSEAEDKENQDPDLFENDGNSGYESRSFELSKRMGRSTVDYQDILDGYHYQKSWSGPSTSSFMYSLAGQLQKCDLDVLWSCIVGVTACFIIERASEERYLTDIELLCNEAHRMSESLGSFSHSLSQSTSSSAGIQSVPDTSDMTPPSWTARKCVIQEQEELRFFLLQHWSLYQAMACSPYVASVLHPWSERGKKRLESLFAKMGIPLQESIQPFSFLDPQVKKRVFHQLEQHGPEEGLGELFISTFVRKCGYKLRVSATDTVYAINAILSHSTLCVPMSTPNSDLVSNIDGSSIVPGSITQSRSQNSKLNDNFRNNASASQVTKHNFYFAFDALDVQNVHLLQTGIHYAKTLMQRVIRTASNLFNLRILKNLKRFYLGILPQSTRGFSNRVHGPLGSTNRALAFDRDPYSVTDSNSTANDTPWANVSSMCLLAGFVSNVQHAKLPLILASLLPAKRQYIVITYLASIDKTDHYQPPPIDDHDENRTKPLRTLHYDFLSSCRRTAEKLHISIHYNGPGYTYMYIDQHEFSAFIQMLQSTLASNDHRLD